MASTFVFNNSHEDFDTNYKSTTQWASTITILLQRKYVPNVGQTCNNFFIPWETVAPSFSLNLFNLLTPLSDQDRISPYNINTTSTR